MHGMPNEEKKQSTPGMSFRGKLKMFGGLKKKPNKEQTEIIRLRAELISGDLPPIPKTSSVIYFLQSESTGLIKIGVTNSLHRRMKEFSTGNAERHDLLLVVAGTPKDERAFHLQFAVLRERGVVPARRVAAAIHPRQARPFHFGDGVLTLIHCA